MKWTHSNCVLSSHWRRKILQIWRISTKLRKGSFWNVELLTSGKLSLPLALLCLPSLSVRGPPTLTSPPISLSYSLSLFLFLSLLSLSLFLYLSLTPSPYHSLFISPSLYLYLYLSLFSLSLYFYSSLSLSLSLSSYHWPPHPSIEFANWNKTLVVSFVSFSACLFGLCLWPLSIQGAIRM